MEGRTIATHGGGDLVIGGGPPIDGVLHGWYYAQGQRGSKGAYGFILAHGSAEILRDALHFRHDVKVSTFTGTVRVTFTKGLACFWFCRSEEVTPEMVMRLYEGAIDAAVDAIGQALNPMAPMPFNLHDTSLTAPAREELEQLLAEGLVRRAA